MEIEQSDWEYLVAYAQKRRKKISRKWAGMAHITNT